jgi:ATP-dependent Clp protease protease subunit
MSKTEEEMGARADELIDAIYESANMPRPAPELQHIQGMDVDVDGRTLYVSGEITEDFGAWFTASLKYLEKRSDKPITIWLNTPGGDVMSMFVFSDLVHISPCEITVIGTGQVCSAGVLMLACGHKRLVTESCILMSHRSTDAMSGNLEEMESYIKVVKWQEDHWSELMARYTPDFVEGKARDSKYWFQLGKKTSEWWVTGGEAIVREGIADEVLRRD